MALEGWFLGLTNVFQLVREVHEELGHFGVRRTHSDVAQPILVGRHVPRG